MAHAPDTRRSSRWCLALSAGVVILAGITGPATAQDTAETVATADSQPPVPPDLEAGNDTSDESSAAGESPDLTPAARLPAEPASDDVAAAPLPHQADGVLIPGDGNQHAWLWLPRAVLFVPRLTLEIPFAVSRYGLWAYDHYDVKDRLVELFFNDDETIGLYPSAFFETGFGLNAGARFVWRDIAGKEASFHARAGYGGRQGRVLQASLDSGELFGDRVEVEATIDYEVQPRSRFFGIGNGDLVALPDTPDPDDPAPGTIDPLYDDTAIATRFFYEMSKAELTGDLRLDDVLSLRASAGYRHVVFGGEMADQLGDLDVAMAYDTSTLVGHDTGLDSLCFELEVAHDTRRATRIYLPERMLADGRRLNAWLGYQHGLSDDPSRFARLGAEAQQFIDLWQGTRILALRARFEAVSGALDRIPFIDLPALGGPYVLRGYDRDRFRDRYAGLITAEYGYPIKYLATGFVFVEAGRVWRDFNDLDLAGNRLAFGWGLQFYTPAAYLGRLSLASSVDGGVQLQLSLDPVFGSYKRAERAK